MREFALMLIALVSYPLIPLWDLGVALAKCVVLLSIYPLVVVATIITSKERKFYFLDKWRKLVNVGTKYEE